jgi:sugar porter (SP) family MFS transporter
LSHLSEEKQTMINASDDESIPLVHTTAGVSRFPSVATIGVVCFAALSGFLFGYDTSAISGVLLVLPALSVPRQELFVSVALAAAAVGSPVGGVVSDRFGRRIAIGISSLLFTAGSLLLALGPQDETYGFAVLLTGRVIVGAAIGVSSAVVPNFVAELSPPKWRGMLVGVQCIAITGGQFVSYMVDYALLPNWRWMLGVPVVPAVVQFVGVLFFLPESPVWLASHNRADDAHAVIRRIARLPADVDAALADLSNTLKIRQLEPRTLSERVSGLWQARAPLLLGCALQGFQQFIGINTLMYYSAVILAQSGFGDNSHPADAMLMSSSIAAANFVFTVAAVLLVDRVGRRTLMLWTLPGVVVSLALLSVTFFAMSAAPGSALALPVAVTSKMALSGMLLYIAFFASGMGVLPWLVNGEIFNPAIAGSANGLTTATNWISNLIAAMTFLTAFTNSSGAAFAAYGVVAAISWLFFFWKMPETKGLSFSEIQLRFHVPKEHAPKET